MTDTKVIFTKATDKVKFVAKLSEDKLKLFVDIEPIPGQAIFKDELLGIIREFTKNIEVNDGVIEDIIKHLHKNEKVEDRRISKGTPAEDGADGKILLLFKKFTPQPENKENTKGYTDLTELHLFDNVTKGQVVGRVYGPKNGTDGVDAVGEKIPSKPGKPVKLSLDNTVIVQEEKNSDRSYQILIAQEDGFLTEESGKVSIKPELVVTGDLDYRFGSIDFIGKVVVNGDVLPGFNIKAAKGIDIKGSVRGGNLQCQGGDIVVKEFVYGGKDSRVICGRSFSAKVIQEVNAEIAGDIRITKEVMDSKLRTETAVYVTDGQLVGGETYVVCGVEAKFLGNHANKETHIFFCSDVESHTSYSKLVANIESHEKAKQLMELHLGPLAANPARIQLLHSPHREKMSAMFTKMQQIERSRIGLLAQKSEMLEKAKTNQVIRANYMAACYEGVIIKAGENVHTVHEEKREQGSITYNSEQQTFEVGPYQPLVSEFIQKDNVKKEGEKNEPKKT